MRMQTLELKIPPPAVAVLIAGAMWGISLVTPLLEVPAFIRVAVAVTIAPAGGGYSLAGVISFRRARTTVNPMKPESTSSLVCSGVYRLTRNPMYAFSSYSSHGQYFCLQPGRCLGRWLLAPY